MGHFIVFAFLAIFICGSWAAFAAWQKYKASGVALFRSLFQYIVSFNLLIFGSFVARYTHTNLIGDDPYQYSPAIWVGSAAGVFVLEAGVTWTILCLAWKLRNKALSRIHILTFVAAITLIGISYVIGATVLIRGGSPRWIIGTHQALSLFTTLGFAYALLGLILGRNRKLNADQRRSARCFGWLLLGGLLVVPVSIALPRSIYMLGFAAGLFWASYAPLLWLHRFSAPFHRQIKPEEASQTMAMLAKRHGITRREQEVMALLVEGKSNKEIEDLLCISFSTVKNHVYNLYRKLEVNSRTQLMHRVMVECNADLPRDSS